MVFQDPMTSFNPVYRVGNQIVEAIRAHRATIGKREARERGRSSCSTRSGSPTPARRVDDYPHEFSGGMRQRAMIAMALALEPERADRRRADDGARRDDPGADPRPARGLNRERGLATILITHDLGVVAEVADRVLVMYAGRVVEAGTLDEIFYDPQHPYTWGLLGSLTRLDRPRPAPAAADQRRAARRCSTCRAGCSFRPRCPHEFDHCTEMPALEARLAEAPAHRDRCWLERRSRSASCARSTARSAWRRRP